MTACRKYMGGGSNGGCDAGWNPGTWCLGELEQDRRVSCFEEIPEEELPSHIYTTKNYGSQQIKLLCTEEYTDAKERPGWSGGWDIDNIRQWSLGAGHNATCPQCLIKYAERVYGKNKVLLDKILDLARKGLEK